MENLFLVDYLAYASGKFFLICSTFLNCQGWVSIGSLDGFLYSVSPTGDLKKFLKSSALDSVIRVTPILDCSGFALYVTQTHMEAKISRIIGNYTYVSAMNPVNLIFFVLSPATGAIYSRGKFSGESTDTWSKFETYGGL